MRNLRLLITMSVIGAGGIFVGHCPVSAQDTVPISITVKPIQYAAVKGNVDKFRELTGIKDGANAGVSNITFIKNINKDISVDLEASGFVKTEDYDDHLILRDGDLAFLRIDYKSFRKYYDNTGGVYKDAIGGTPFPASLSGVKADSPDLQMDISYFKLETGLGPMSDPDLDVAYEHDVKDGAKSLLMWSDATPSGNTPLGTNPGEKIGPSWQKINDTVDTVTLKEKKVVAGVTFKAEQRAEIDYNHNFRTSQFITTDTSEPSNNQKLTQEAFPDAKLFSSGVRGEKWILNDKTFLGLGYHYTHIHATELMRTQQFDAVGNLTNYTFDFPVQSFWSYANNLEDKHVWAGNINSDLTPDLNFTFDLRYEYMGRKGVSNYLDNSSTASDAGTAPDSTVSTIMSNVENRENRVGEHVALRYYGIKYTSLYAEGDFQQDRNWVTQARSVDTDPSQNFSQEVIDRSQKESWTLGGRTVLNRFFSVSAQVRQRWQDDKYDLVSGNNADLFLDELRMNGEEASSTLDWKPYHWLRNSFRYQFSNSRYFPRDTAYGSGIGQIDASENHMLSSVFTYEATLQPVEPLLLVLSYSHVESYIKTFAGSSSSLQIPTFNSGDNSWLLSASYAPKENVIWTNSVMYTLADNYQSFPFIVTNGATHTTGLPLGSSFKQLTLTTGVQWTIHKWLTVGPTYEYASYRDNPLVGAGTYSANIFTLDVKFDW